MEEKRKENVYRMGKKISNHHWDLKGNVLVDFWEWFSALILNEGLGCKSQFSFHPLPSNFWEVAQDDVIFSTVSGILRQWRKV